MISEARFWDLIISATDEPLCSLLVSASGGSATTGSMLVVTADDLFSCDTRDLQMCNRSRHVGRSVPGIDRQQLTVVSGIGNYFLSNQSERIHL
jgi:hypothetical protein